MSTISLKGLDKADVLAALYNASRPQGMGFMAYESSPMNREEAASLLASCTYFDYLKGRVMKVDLNGDELDPYLYDRDNGRGAAEFAIDAMRAGDNAAIDATHEAGKQEAAEAVRGKLDTPHAFEVKDGVAHIALGLVDVADDLGPAVDRATD